MVSLLVDSIELCEIRCILKRELDEILLNLEGGNIKPTIKRSLLERYNIVYNLYIKVTPPSERLK